MREVILRQRENTKSPTLVNDFGRVSEVILLQPENVCAPNVVNEFDSVSEVIPLQPENASFPTLVSEFGSVREVIPTQRKNAELPTLVNEFGSVREVIPRQPENARLSILVNVCGRVTKVRSAHHLNVSDAIVSTPSGTTTLGTLRAPTRNPTTALPLIFNTDCFVPIMRCLSSSPMLRLVQRSAAAKWYYLCVRVCGCMRVSLVAECVVHVTGREHS